MMKDAVAFTLTWMVYSFIYNQASALLRILQLFITLNHGSNRQRHRLYHLAKRS